MGGALIIFGATELVNWGKRAIEWIFGWNSYSLNELYWSYWLAVTGAILLFICGLCYFIEGRRVEMEPPPERKPMTVTTVYYPSGQDFIPYTAV